MVLMSKRRIVIEQPRRGQAGAQALRRHKQEVVAENKRKVLEGLKRLKDQGIPLVVEEFARNIELSISTLNRPPYSFLIKQYRDDERTWLAPNTAHTIAELTAKLRKAEEDRKIAEEKYLRLKKEITSFHRLFDQL